jgi:(2Fe-2S) ferredoxin
MKNINVEHSYYKHHVFFCLNAREKPESCCAHQGANEAFDYCKSRIKSLGINGAGSVRVNKAGCLDRCAGGPVLVVYPEAVWYTFLDNSDIDEIIESHLKNGKPVTRLLLPENVGR